MGYHYTQRVYDFVRDTTSTQQAVLVALAHRADDKTGKCFPKQETLAGWTRLSRSSVDRALNGLRSLGYLKWVCGGRKKSGRALSNSYTLTLPTSERQGPTSDPQCDTALSHSESVHCPTVRHCTDPQCDTIIDISNKIKPDYNTVAPRKSGFDLSSDAGSNDEWGESVEAVLRALENPEPSPQRTTPSAKPVSLVQLAMEATETEALEDRKTFSRVMMNLSSSECQEEIFRFISEKRHGEMASVRNLPALLVSRLQAHRRPPET